MKSRDAPYKELTDPKNEKINSTLNARAWAKLTVLATKAVFFEQEPFMGDFNPDQHNGEVTPSKVKSILPLETLIHEARQSSGAIKGQHRKDLVDALQGVREGKQGLAVVEQDDGGL